MTEGDDTYRPPAGGPVEAMACAVCGYVVDTYTEDIGDVEVNREWHHTAAFVGLDADHLVVPVPVAWIRTNFICDFCLAEGARWSLPAEKFMMADGFGSEDDWAACDVCASALRAKDWNKIIYRAMKTHRERSGEVWDRSVWDELYRRLRKHITGPVRLHVVKPEEAGAADE